MAFSISKYAQTVDPGMMAPRSIDTVTVELLRLKQDLAHNIIGIGQHLIEAKAMLSHGEWLPWLSEQAHFSEKTAQNYMRVAREFPNPQLVADLGVRKALALLELPPPDREEFAEDHNVLDMTARQLESAIKERNDALLAAETANASALAAEESRAKMEADLRSLENIHRAAQEGEAQARQELETVRAELQALREKPVEVAIETVVDEEALKNARSAAIAEMQAKVDQAEAARKEAETKRKEAEKALGDAKKQAGANAAILSRAEKAEAELAEARRQLEAAAKEEKRSVVNQNGDMALFNVLFQQTQEQINKMHGLRIKLGKDDKVLDEKLKTAIKALADAVRRCAE